MKFIDYPTKYDLISYENAIKNQVKNLSQVSGVRSIYQIGGVSTPGISDIDLVVVFKDGFSYRSNPIEFNNEVANYLFTHGLYGASESDFEKSLNFTFFHNYKLLYGEERNIEATISEELQQVLKQQIALEFLFKMYINLSVQKAYKTIKLRSLFLHIKALPYDFEFLKVQPESILNQINKGINLRNNYFTHSISDKEIALWFTEFYEIFQSYLGLLFGDRNFYAPSDEFKIAPNIKISNSGTLKFSKNGMVFPNIFGFLGKKYFNALNRINQFRFEVPISPDVPRIIQNYFEFVDHSSTNNKLNLPYFMPMTSSLRVYK